MGVEILFLTCPPRIAAPLVDELTDKLEAAHIPARVLRYGMTTKARDGFIMLACAQGFPADFVKTLHQDSEITDYVVCSDDDPSQQQEPGAADAKEEGQA